jgi:hypothetical protein
MFADSLACWTAIAGCILRRNQETVSITESTLTQYAFYCEVLITWLADQCHCPTSIMRSTRRAERNFLSNKTFRRQDGVIMLTNVPTTRIGFSAVGEQLSAR